MLECRQDDVKNIEKNWNKNLKYIKKKKMNLVSDVLKTRCVLKANLMGFQKKGKKNYSIKGSKGKFLINNKEKSILPANITLSTPANPTKVSLKCPKKKMS